MIDSGPHVVEISLSDCGIAVAWYSGSMRPSSSFLSLGLAALLTCATSATALAAPAPAAAPASQNDTKGKAQPKAKATKKPQPKAKAAAAKKGKRAPAHRTNALRAPAAGRQRAAKH
jgi:hypothetical protein